MAGSSPFMAGGFTYLRGPPFHGPGLHLKKRSSTVPNTTNILKHIPSPKNDLILIYMYHVSPPARSLLCPVLFELLIYLYNTSPRSRSRYLARIPQSLAAHCCQLCDGMLGLRPSLNEEELILVLGPSPLGIQC